MGLSNNSHGKCIVPLLFLVLMMSSMSMLEAARLLDGSWPVKELRGYNWADAVYELLMYHIPRCAAWCRILEEGGDQSVDSYDEEDVKKKKNKRKKKLEEEVENNKGKKKLKEDGGQENESREEDI
ncbi:hypothetical protein FCM35_KLT16170 [Carex littledalei]|uniref:Transmembrane protein n=1 Tax=Carex littledalei TaxID=544730 RepID=A0A833RXE6_9POAL|nr:hypothetical protein FCM35_KLT16170 [Carex littledalei]